MADAVAAEAQAPDTGGMADWCRRCRGRRIVGAMGVDAQRAAAADIGHPDIPEPDCPVCEGAFADADAWLQTTLDALAKVDHERFQLGALFPTPCEALEKQFIHEDGPKDTLRTEANRLLAPLVEAATGTKLDLAEPEIAVVIDTRFWSANVDPRSVFVKGRYNKLRRDIPQTHWPCKRCQGPGCYDCQGDGVQYAESVEETIGDIMAPLFAGESYSFHGAGREDIDALMLGTGRPFVLEVKRPRRRHADLEAITAAVNATTEQSGVAVRDLHIVAKPEVARIKEGAYDKEYLAHCETDADVGATTVEAACAAIEGVTLQQRTPERVAHRRADLVRERRVHKLRLTEYRDARHFTLQVHADSGAYIKELVSGDGGRTTPNVAEALGVGCHVAELDVCAILDGLTESTPPTTADQAHA